MPAGISEAVVEAGEGNKALLGMEKGNIDGVELVPGRDAMSPEGADIVTADVIGTAKAWVEEVGNVGANAASNIGADVAGNIGADDDGTTEASTIGVGVVRRLGRAKGEGITPMRAIKKRPIYTIRAHMNSYALISVA